jgi:hypothetical protein
MNLYNENNDDVDVNKSNNNMSSKVNIPGMLI